MGDRIGAMHNWWGDNGKPDYLGLIATARAAAALPVAQADAHAASQGLEHGIPMVVASRLRAVDLSIDPAPAQAALGYADDDVPAAIDETLRVVLREE